MKQTSLFGILAALIMAFQFSAAAQQPSPQERVATLKRAIQQGQAQLKAYEWVETTTVFLNGDPKSQTQKRCFYGADGKVQKVVIPPAAPPPDPPRGLKGRIIAKKKEEMTDYMKDAADLIHSYVPPDAEKLKASDEKGNSNLDAFESNKLMRVSFRNIIKTGDLMTIGLDLAKNAITDLKVASYLDDAKDTVNLAVVFKLLPDGTSYGAQTTLDAPAKNIKVVVANSGHKLR